MLYKNWCKCINHCFFVTCGCASASIAPNQILHHQACSAVQEQNISCIEADVFEQPSVQTRCTGAFWQRVLLSRVVPEVAADK